MSLPEALPARPGRLRHSRAPSSSSPRTARSDARPARLQGLLQGRRGHPRGARRRGLAPLGRRGRDRRATASSGSPTARRSCSSPRAARTSRRSTSRASSSRSRRSPRRWRSATGAPTWSRSSRSTPRASPRRPSRRAAPRERSRRRPAARVFRAYLERQIEAVNARLARYETIKKFALAAAGALGRGGRAHPDPEAQAPGDPRAATARRSKRSTSRQKAKTAAVQAGGGAAFLTAARSGA